MFSYPRGAFFVAIFLLPVLASPLYGGATPTSFPGVSVVDAVQVKALAETGAIIIDPRTKMEYSEEHIKFTHEGKVIEAIYMRFKDRSENKVDFDLSKDTIKKSVVQQATAGDKSKKLIFYCNGTSCWKSYKAIKHLKEDGYSSLYWFRGGIPAWKAKGFGTSK
jgi:rhodanese-related sulfurtransferase